MLTQEIVTNSAKKEFVDQENQAELVAPFMEEAVGPDEEKEMPEVPEINMAYMNKQSPVKFNEQPAMKHEVEEEVDEIPDMTP